MRKNNVFSLMLGVLACSMLYVCPARAQWPTLDISAVFNNIKTFVAQGQTQVSTVQETVSTVNIQQSIGDKLGGLNKLKDLAAKKDALEEKIAKQKKRMDQINEMRQKYDEAKAKVDDAKAKVDDAKNKVDEAKAKVDEAKETAANAKAIAQSSIDGVKEQAQGALGQGEQLFQNAQDKVSNISGVNPLNTQPADTAENEELGKINKPTTDTAGPKAFSVKSAEPVKDEPVANSAAEVKNVAVDKQVLKTDNSLKKTTDLKNDEDAKPVVETLGSSTVATKPTVKVNKKLETDVDLWDEEEPTVVTLGTSSGRDGALQKEPLSINKVNLPVKEGAAPVENSETPAQNSATSAPKTPTATPSQGPKAFSVKTEKLNINVPEKQAGALSDAEAAQTVTPSSKTKFINKLNTIEEEQKDDGVKKGVVTLGTSSGVTNAVATPTGTIKEPVVSPVVSGADETKNVQNLKQTNTTKEKLLNKSRGATVNTPKAFKKVSFQMNASLSFAQEGTCTLFGTNADGYRVVPDDLASICCVGYDGKNDKDFTMDESVATKCIEKLCGLVSGSDAKVVAENKKKFNKIRAQVVASSFAVGNEMKQKYLDTSKSEEELEKLKSNASGDENTQLAGNAELTTANIETQRDLIAVRACDLELSMMDALEGYCQNGVGYDDEEEAPKKVGTNEAGDRIMPDKLADICNIGYDIGSDKDPDINETVMTSCIDTICGMLNASDASTAAENKKKFNKIYEQALAHSFSVAYQMKQKYLNKSKMDEEFDKIKDDTAGVTRDQGSGNSELNNADINTYKDLLLIKSSSLELSAVDAISTYCQNYASAE